MHDETRRAKAQHLVHVMNALATAVGKGNTALLSEYLSDNGVSKAEQTAMLRRGCFDSGALYTALAVAESADQKITPTSTPLMEQPVKKARVKRKAPAKKKK